MRTQLDGWPPAGEMSPERQGDDIVNVDEYVLKTFITTGDRGDDEPDISIACGWVAPDATFSIQPAFKRPHLLRLVGEANYLKAQRFLSELL